MRTPPALSTCVVRPVLSLAVCQQPQSRMYVKFGDVDIRDLTPKGTSRAPLNAHCVVQRSRRTVAQADSAVITLYEDISV